MSTDAPSLLFTMTGQEGKIKRLNKSSNNFKISFDISDDGLVWFQDRPGRNSGTGEVSYFSEKFKTLYDGDMPNSALSYTDKNTGNNHTLIIKNKSFKYNKKKERLVTKAVLANDYDETENPDGISCGMKHSMSDDELTNYKGAKFDTGSLFIDNMSKDDWAAIGYCVGCAAAIGITIYFAEELADIMKQVVQVDTAICKACVSEIIAVENQ